MEDIFEQSERLQHGVIDDTEELLRISLAVAPFSGYLFKVLNFQKHAEALI